MMKGTHESLVETIFTHPSVWFGYISQKNKHARATVMTNKTHSGQRGLRNVSQQRDLTRFMISLHL